MENLPILVQEIIDWYQWKDRVREINSQFLSSFEVVDICFPNPIINCRLFSVRGGRYFLMSAISSSRIVCRFDK